MTVRAMKLSVRLLTILLVLVASTANSQSLPTASPESVGVDSAKLAEIDQVVKRYIAEKRFSGAVTIVARRGKVIHFEARGSRNLAAKLPMEKDTIFRIYSMTKAIISVAALMLCEEGKLELDAPSSRFVPELKKVRVRGGEKPRREMTVRDLLRHTSGLPNNVTTDRALRRAGLPPLHESTLEEMTKRLEHVPLIYHPGEGWHYSFATEVLAYLVEVGSGQRLDRFLQKRIFTPLGMKDTAFLVPKEKRHRFAEVYGRDLRRVDAPQPGTSGRYTFETMPKFLSGGGGLCSTATDYMRFCLMLHHLGELDGVRLLKKETVEEMRRNHLPKQLIPISRPPKGRGFGLGFAVRVERVDSEPSSIGEYEWLGGAGTEFWLSPRDELVVITLTQAMPMSDLGSRLKPIVYGSLLPEESSISPAPPSRDRYLLLDSRIVESTDNAKLTIGSIEKSEHNPLFREEKPWEPRYDNVYANVIWDAEEKIYKCWYNGFVVDERTTSTPPEKRNPYDRPDYMGIRPNRREEAIAYATSKDGLSWEKLELGFVDFEGSKKNNLLVRGPSGTGVFKDLRDPDPARRYKMFFSGTTNNIQRVSFSPDGLRWSKPILCPEIEAGGDTHNCALWSPELGRYVGIMRLWEGHRVVGRTDTENFVRWTKSKAILRGDKRNQTHDMVIARTGGIYIGLVGIMKYPEPTGRRGVRQHVELAWSPDSITWHRVQKGTPFIGPTSTKNTRYGTMPYDWGCIFPSSPIIGDNEIRIYYGASDWYFFDWRKGSLALAKLRADGWAGYEPEDGSRPAKILTKPFTWRGHRLRISADVSAGGWVEVDLLDTKGKALARSERISSTVTDAPVPWKEFLATDSPQGPIHRLAIRAKGAKVYSFSFLETK